MELLQTTKQVTLLLDIIKIIIGKKRPMNKKIFIDTFGNKWNVGIIGDSPVKVESGDYMLFNNDLGFMFCTENAFHQLYKIYTDENTQGDDLFDVDIISIQTTDSTSINNEQIL